MPSSVPTWNIPLFRDFTGGENLQVQPDAIAPNEVVSASNCVITNEGLLETRLGKTKVNTTSLGTGGILSAHRYSKENGSRYILVQHGTALYAKSWDGSTPFTTWGTAVKTGLTAAKKLRSVTWKDKLILTNGTDQAFTFDGSVCADVAAIPKTKVLVVYSGRLWAIDEATGFLENSNLEDYTDWTDSGSYKVRDGDGDRLVTLAPVSGGMVLFKRNSVQTFYGSNLSDAKIGEPFSQHIGCVSPDAALVDGVFMGLDNIYSFGLNSIEAVKQTHSPLIESLTPTQQAQIFAIPHPNTRRALFQLPTTDDRILCMDGRHAGATTSWYGMNASCFAVCDDAGDSGRLVFGDADNGFLYMYYGSTDDGSSLTTRIKTAYMDHGITSKKEWKSYYPDIKTLDTLVTYRFYHGYDVDYQAAGGMLTASFETRFLTWGVDEWGTANWGAGNRFNSPVFIHNARGNRISFDTVAHNRITFNGFTTRFRTVGARI